jgi:hypothetical protein
VFDRGTKRFHLVGLFLLVLRASMMGKDTFRSLIICLLLLSGMSRA